MEIDLEERLQKLVTEGYDVQQLIDELKRPDLAQFHLKDGRGKPTGVFDKAIFDYICNEHSLFVLGATPYIYDHGVFRADANGAKLKTMIRDLIYPEFVKSTTLRRIYDLFISAAELQADYDQLNNYPAHWICFKNGLLDPITGEMHEHDPRYRTVNQIPHDYCGTETRGETVDEWLRFIAPDDNSREMLLEFAGLCMTHDTRQQKFLILNGLGNTGKSTVIRLIETMIGADNVSSISLSELTQRFAAYGLLGKLLNSCADIAIDALSDVSILKKILGEDTLRGEQKGRDAVSFRSYAKLIFSANELPIVKSERTNGFYRRLLVLPMNRVPDVKRTDLFDQLKQEIGHFIRLCVEALHRMYERGTIIESRQSIEAVERLRMDSDTVAAFLNDEAVVMRGERVGRAQLYEAYREYCLESDRQWLTRNSFYRAMRSKNFADTKSDDWYFSGLTLRSKALPFL
jgi:P4 family phage/plasmid primase-like protien